jgi:hypothetical protein
MKDGDGYLINNNLMRYTISDLIMAYMTLATGLIISVVAIWYSVAGLAAIFSAAAIPIIVMGVVLEVSKLVATVWLKWNWRRAPWHIKSYLIIAITVLMLITSMGIFGFLSKAHLDQEVPTGEVSAQVALIDEKINNERETIANARTLLGQLDKAVSDISSAPDREVNGRIISSAERALQVRRSQSRDRANLTQTIEQAQARIVKLQEEKAPIANQLRAVEAEVGPIKYVAALIYGDNPDVNLLERAVRWVIIIIVLVFDPLAVALLLASQYSFQWLRQQDEEDSIKIKDEYRDDPHASQDIDYPKDNPRPFPQKDSSIEIEDPHKKNDKDLAEEINTISPEVKESADIDHTIEKHEESKKSSDENFLKTDTISIKDDSDSIISGSRPDHDLEAKPDFIDPAIEEAIKWAKEQTDKTGYIQNAEQNQGTVWQKIKAVKNK